MSLYFEPIHPNLSLSQNQENEIADVPLQSEAGLYSGLSVNCTNFTLSAMLDLQFDFAKFDSKANVQFYMLEMACYTPTIQKVQARNGTISFERLGVGFRVGVASWAVSMSVASNLGAVAASVSVNSSGSAHEVQTFGGEAISSLKVLRQVGLLSGMTPETLRLLAIAGSQVADIFSDPKSDIKPVPMLAAKLDVANKGPVAAAVSMQFANESIYRKRTFIKSMSDAISKARPAEKVNLNSVVARAAYVEFGIDGAADTPTDQQKDAAGKILFLGR